MNKNLHANETDAFDMSVFKIGVPQVLQSFLKLIFLKLKKNIRIKEFYPNGLSSDNLAAWNNALRIFDKLGILPLFFHLFFIL